MENIKTKILLPTNDNIQIAANAILSGGLVGMPTETVYGLAANAMDEQAVSSIFDVKGRPQDNPLIVHINQISMMAQLVADIPSVAKRLAELYWSGPLTLVLPKSKIVSSVVSAGLDTVGIRFPSHPVAQKLIEACGCPLAAPSANLSGSPSPTTAEHVLDDLNGRIPYILDGGECLHGIESTVVYICGEEIQLLRPGSITIEQLKAVGAKVSLSSGISSEIEKGETIRSPGMKYKHYAPKAKVIILDGSLEQFAHYIEQHKQEHDYAMVFAGEENKITCPTLVYGTKENSETQAHDLFSALRKMDELHVCRVFVRCPDKQGIGFAVYNRLLRSSGFTVIHL